MDFSVLQDRQDILKVFTIHVALQLELQFLMTIRTFFSAPSRRNQEDQEYTMTALRSELCDAMSELQVLLGQGSDIWDGILREKELCCGIL